MRYRKPALLAAILLISLNLRPLMAAIGPVLDLIEADIGLGSAKAGLLTTLPVLIMGVGALAGNRLRLALGEKGGIMLGTAGIAFACAMRLPFHGTAGLMLSAALAGLGIATVQVLLPGMIKHRFGQATGNVMGLYTTGIMTGSALGAAGAADLARAFGWPGALAIWALPAITALLVWWRIAPADPRPSSPASPARLPSQHRFYRTSRAWALVAFFGLGTGAYTLAIAWLPPYYQALGVSREGSGYLLAGLTVTEVFAGLAIAAFIGRFPDRRGPILVVLACLMAGFIMLVSAPLTLAIPCIILLGIGMGSVFPLGLIVTMDHLHDPVSAGNLAGFVQGWGYILAASLPFLAGVIRDHSASLTQAWYLMMAGVVVMAALATGFCRTSYDHFQKQTDARTPPIASR